MTEEQEAALEAWNGARATLARAIVTQGSSSPLAARRNVEQQYAIAHKTAVNAGVANPLRKKYRLA